jgi:hypothetical protein
MADSKKLDWAGHDAPRSDDIDWGGQAFPTEGGDQSALYPDPGMSLRHWYAGQALPGLIQGYAVAYGSPTSAIAEICNEAVNFADELILALKAGG